MKIKRLTSHFMIGQDPCQLESALPSGRLACRDTEKFPGWPQSKDDSIMVFYRLDKRANIYLLNLYLKAKAEKICFATKKAKVSKT